MNLWPHGVAFISLLLGLAGLAILVFVDPAPDHQGLASQPTGDSAGGAPATVEPHRTDLPQRPDNSRQERQAKAPQPSQSNSQPGAGDNRDRHRTSRSATPQRSPAEEASKVPETTGNTGDGDSNNDRSPTLGDAVGPARWMAEPDDVDVAALERELLHSAADQAFELSFREDRRRAIDAAGERIRQCYDHWRARGQDAEIITAGIDDNQIALAATMHTEAGRGRLENPQILFQRGPRDDRFEQCVLDSLAGLAFDAEGDGASEEIRWAPSP